MLDTHNQPFTLEVHLENDKLQGLRKDIVKETEGMRDACNEGKTLYKREFIIDNFLGMTPSQKKDALSEVYEKVKPFIEKVNDCLMKQPEMRLRKRYEERINEGNLPFHKIWSYVNPNYLVFGETLKIDMDCRTEGKIEISYFHQKNDIRGQLSDEFCEQTGLRYIDQRYRRTFDIVDNNMDEVFGFLDKLLDEIEKRVTD